LSAMCLREKKSIYKYYGTFIVWKTVYMLEKVQEN